MEPKRQTSSTVSGDNMDSVAELWPSTRGSPAVSEGEGEAGGALLFSRCGSVWFSSSHSSLFDRQNDFCGQRSGTTKMVA